MASLEEAIKQAKFPNELIKANLNVLYTANWLHNKISNKIKPFNVTHEQFNILKILKGKHPESMCQKDILSRMIAPNSNVTLIIKKLLNKNFITVSQSKMDKREYKINISKIGVDLLKEIEKSVLGSTNKYSNLSESEAFHLNALLDKLREE